MQTEPEPEAAESVAERLTRLRAELAQLAAASGREPTAVRLIAVSKTVAPEVVRAAYEAGQRDFGENRVQELLAKQSVLPADVRWHLIGHLQRNKVRAVLPVAHAIHAVDSLALLERLAAVAAELGGRPTILLEVNLSGETTKFGQPPAGLAALGAAALVCPQVHWVGLMTMAPYGAGEAELRAIFGGLRRLRDELAQRHGVALPELSMGMSADYRIAVAEGATMVRIGTAIFGARA